MFYSRMFKRLRKHLRNQKILFNTQINHSEFEKRFFIHYFFEFVSYNTHCEY